MLLLYCTWNNIMLNLLRSHKQLISLSLQVCSFILIILGKSLHAWFVWFLTDGSSTISTSKASYALFLVHAQEVSTEQLQNYCWLIIPYAAWNSNADEEQYRVLTDYIILPPLITQCVIKDTTIWCNVATTPKHVASERYYCSDWELKKISLLAGAIIFEDRHSKLQFLAPQRLQCEFTQIEAVTCGLLALI